MAVEPLNEENHSDNPASNENGKENTGNLKTPTTETQLEQVDALEINTENEDLSGKVPEEIKAD